MKPIYRYLVKDADGYFYTLEIDHFYGYKRGTEIKYYDVAGNEYICTLWDYEDRAYNKSNEQVAKEREERRAS